MAPLTRSCPKCQGPLTVPQPAPEKIVCPNCRAIMKISTGKSPDATPGAPASHAGQSTGAPQASVITKAKMTAGFELQRELARGGLGVVWLAFHPRLKHYRAIKRPQPRGDLDDEILLGRFQRETEALGTLESKHIIRVYDAGADAEGPYLVMEYLDGESLSSLVSRHRQLPVSEACELIRQAALGLQAAHECGLVHRDIKPSNLMLARATAGTARVTVIDWGLVKRMGDTDAPTNRLTKIRTELGTPDFISPEQVRDAHSVDIRADIYSLGATLYFLLAGQSPFHGRSDEQKQLAQAREEFPPLEKFRPDVPQNLLNVLKKMVKKERDQRYATPREVAAALQPFACAEPHRTLALLAPVSHASSAAVDTGRILDEKTQLAPPPSASPAPPTQPQSGRMFLWLAAAAGLFVALSACVLMAAVGVWLIGKDREPKDAALVKGKSDEESKNAGDGKDGAKALLQLPPKGQTLKTGTLSGHGNGSVCTSLTFLADGSRAASRYSGSVFYWDLVNRRQDPPDAKPLERYLQVGFITLSPDGKRLATSANNSIQIFDGKSHKQEGTTLVLGDWCTAMVFSPDGKQLATAELYKGDQGRVRFTDLEYRTPQGDRDITLGAPVVSLSYSPDNQHLMTVVGGFYAGQVGGHNIGERRIRVWRLQDGKQVQEFIGHPNATAGGAFFADGKRIFTASPFDGTLRTWSIDNIEKDGGIRELAEKRIQAGTNDTTLKHLSADSKDTKQICCIAFWPWGRALTGYMGGGVKVWDLDAGAGKPPIMEIDPPEGKTTYVTAAAISPDGAHALVARSDNLIYLYRLPAP